MTSYNLFHEIWKQIFQELTPWSKVFEKLIVAKQVSSFAALHGTRKFFIVVTRVFQWNIT
jgi:hypothetical protein